MGLDYADTEERRTAPRSDTMILFTIDPLSMTAGVLTIPRDMWVNIPGYGYNRINTAYRLGELDELPGGGPGLAMKTVEAFIGVPIQYYAQVDFYAFTEFIDNIGGIELEVPAQIKIDPVGPGNTVILEPGYQLLGGAVSLAYARNRYTEGSDFDRSDRQMQVIMAIRDKIVNLDMLPTLIQKSPAIYEQLSAGIHTNLTLEQIIRLALLAKDVSREDILQRTIGEGEITFGVASNGDQILKPITDKIRILRDEVFTTGGPITPASTNNDPAELMKAEAATVQVKNGSATQGLGGMTTDYLKGLGVACIEPGDVGELLTYTRIYDYTGNPYTVKYLVGLLQIQETQVFNHYDPNATTDVVVELGGDWANNNSLP
jgi:LCP family protein required for cell wall assembly